MATHATLLWAPVFEVPYIGGYPVYIGTLIFFCPFPDTDYSCK